jgi:hypothetical protein
MGLFGTTRDEVWQQLCEEIGGDFIEGGVWKGTKVQAHVGPWTITLDTYLVPTSRTQAVHTRIRAPYINPDGFRFTIYRKGFFSDQEKQEGMQDLEVGIAEFDEPFIIQGNNEEKVRKLFTDTKVRQLIQTQPEIRFEVKDGKGCLGPKHPANVDELHFEVVDVITEKDRLKAIFDLFSAVLEQLCTIGSAAKQEPGVAL